MGVLRFVLLLDGVNHPVTVKVNPQNLLIALSHDGDAVVSGREHPTWFLLGPLEAEKLALHRKLPEPGLECKRRSKNFLNRHIRVI